MCVRSQLVNLRDIMQRFHPEVLVLMAHMLGTNDRSVDESGNIVTDKILPESSRELGPKIFEFFEQHCIPLNLVASNASLKKLITLYRNPTATQGKLQNATQELYGRLLDEMGGQYFLSLDASEASRFEEWESGWEKIIERFPESMRDIEEMNKCFALGRYTASMFHALHVAEWGAIKLGEFIGAEDPKKGWGATERRLRALINGGHQNLPPCLSEKFEFLEQMNREIDSMILAWRHKVDHAANRLAIVPNAEFTPDIAKHIISAVRIFMHRLIEETTG